MNTKTQLYLFATTSGQPVLTQGAVTQKCSSLLLGNTPTTLHFESDVSSVAMICDLSGGCSSLLPGNTPAALHSVCDVSCVILICELSGVTGI